MDDIQKRRVVALKRVSMLPGTAAKRFVRCMAHMLSQEPEKPLTEKQNFYLTGLCWTFRRQLPISLVPPSDPNKKQGGG